MPADIKAVVFKTPQLKATKHFFENVLQLPIKETSAQHFVLYSKGIRLVFIESDEDLEIELYVNDKNDKYSKEELDLPGTTFESSKDPNGINIIKLINTNHK